MSALPQQVECFEKSLIEQALAAHKGSIKDAMAVPGVPRRTLYDKMHKYGLDKKASRVDVRWFCTTLLCSAQYFPVS